MSVELYWRGRNVLFLDEGLRQCCCPPPPRPAWRVVSFETSIIGDPGCETTPVLSLSPLAFEDGPERSFALPPSTSPGGSTVTNLFPIAARIVMVAVSGFFNVECPTFPGFPEGCLTVCCSKKIDFQSLGRETFDGVVPIQTRTNIFLRRTTRPTDDVALVTFELEDCPDSLGTENEDPLLSPDLSITFRLERVFI